MNLTGNDLKQIGFTEGTALGLALDVIEKQYGGLSFDNKLALLRQVLYNPSSFINDPALAPIASELLRPADETIALHVEGKSYQIYGADGIEPGALQQMETAVKIPIAVAGALMPDAHQGYGLPIGGVLATNNAVIPYGVGVDIGCRMCLSVFDIDPKELIQREHYFTRELNEATLFGSGSMFQNPADHEIMERKEFDELGLLKGLQDRAWRQLGSSGSGNHFVEFGIVEVSEQDQVLGLPVGIYLGLL